MYEHTIGFIKEFSKLFLATEDVTLCKAEMLDAFRDRVPEILEEAIKVIDNDYK